MKRAAALLVILTLAACLDAGAGWGKEGVKDKPLIFNIKDACRMPTEEFSKVIKITPAKFRIEKRDSPEWGHDEDWDMLGKEEAASLGLRGISVSIEQGVFRAVYLFPDEKRFTAKEIFARSLRFMGLKPSDVTEHKSKTGRWYTAKDKKGFPISIGEDGSRFECFEHHPGH